MQTKKRNRKDKNESQPDTFNQSDIQNNPDPGIDKDFEGHPHSPASNEIINPKTEVEKKTADLHNKDGEKRNYRKNQTKEEPRDDGSANAFERTENMPRDPKSHKPE